MSLKKKTKRNGVSGKRQNMTSSSRLADLLARIKEEKTWVAERKFARKQFAARLEELESVLLSLPPHKNTLATVSRVEKEFDALQAHIIRVCQRRRRIIAFWKYLLMAVKVVIYMGAYFRLVPPTSLATHPTIYIVVAIILLVVWIIYFVILEKSQHVFFQHTVLPYSQRFPPNTRRNIQLASISYFNLISFTPLFTATNVFPTFINPSWDTFLLTTLSMIITIFTSSAFTALVNGLALLPIISFFYGKLKKRGRRD